MTYTLALHAISDPTRQLILNRLKNSPLSVRDLSAGLPVTRPAVSRHLKILLAGGLVSVRQFGTRRVYSIRYDGFKAVGIWLTNFNPSLFEEQRDIDATSNDASSDDLTPSAQ